METKYEKVLASGGRVAVKLKRKQPEECAVSRRGFKAVLSPSSSAKRSKLGASGKKCSSNAFPTGKRLLNYYSNFKRIGALKRLMFYRNNEWNDFSHDVVDLVNKDLVKNPAVEVEVDGSKILLDFLHMMKLDLGTGLCHPIAWIDISEKCFFPEVVSDYEDEGEEEPLEANDINLHLEIEIHESDAESSGESNTVVDEAQDQDNTVAINRYVGVNESCVKGPIVEADQKCEGNQPCEGNMDFAAVDQPGFVAIDVLKGMFLKAIGSAGANIVEVRRCSSVSMEARWEIFRKQIEITKRYRGDANVQYAWLPCSKKTSLAIQKFGVGHCGHSKIQPVHGVGVHLIPANGTNISIDYFDVDENGTQHMVLCRVIMGNMEFVRSGSDQFHPSAEDYDSGVDNLQTPKKYIVWSMNANSHIYPECIVSFKMTPKLEGPVLENCGKIDNSGISTCDGAPQGPKMPNSPWMSYTMLFDAISGRIPSQSMELLKNNYDLFKNKRISRDTFVRMLRVIVGDPLLKVAITSAQAKMAMKIRPKA